MDLCTASVPIGLFFGRIANFINGELFGRPTTMPWGMVFPEARLHYPEVEPTPRHPSQLYEAALEGLILFLVLRVLTHSLRRLEAPGPRHRHVPRGLRASRARSRRSSASRITRTR